MHDPSTGSSILATPGVSPSAILTDDVTISKWARCGLAGDNTSIEHAAIVAATTRWPLLLDPQLQVTCLIVVVRSALSLRRCAVAQGISWVKSMESGRGLICMRMGTQDMVGRLSRAIEAGTPVLIESVGERIDASLRPVLTRALVKACWVARRPCVGGD